MTGLVQYVTCIGSRETPPDVCTKMTKVGVWLRENGIRGRSGHADGADYAFEQGLLRSCDVYLPWPRFNEKLPMLGVPCFIPVRVVSGAAAMALVEKYHPAPHRLTPGAFSLQVRNGYQVLGSNLDEPSKAVVCWTKYGEAFGGTGQALRIAAGYGIPILNMWYPEFSIAALVIAELERLLVK